MRDSFDPSLNFLFRRSRQLDAIFQPKTIAVIGATENPGSVGRTVMHNLLAAPFPGTLYPVNPKRSSVLGCRAYPSVKELPETPDLAVIVTPAKVVPALIGECADRGVPAAVVISAGFKEMGAPGIALEQEILAQARRGKMRIIGPNCLGVMNPAYRMNATFAAGIAHPGSIAFISQSGALCTAVLDWSLKEKVGFSAFVSIGSMVDVGWGDLIDYFGADRATSSILIYMESVGDARAFLSAAREVSLVKPIILIKAGRSQESAQAAASHTGALAGSDHVLTAALNRVGVLRVDTIASLFGMAEALSKQPRPKGPHLTIVTNAGGPGVIATDALIESGGALTPLSSRTVDAYNALLPPHWSRNNPVDVLGDATPEVYGKAAQIALSDPHTEGLLVILTPQDMTDPLKTAQEIAPLAHQKGVPLFASWMGGESVAAGVKVLTEARIPQFSYPDAACKTFGQMWSYAKRLDSLYEIPALSTSGTGGGEHLEAGRWIGRALQENRELLDEHESKKVVSAYGIPTVQTEVAKTAAEAGVWAEKIGFPAVVKLYSRTITHKTDVGGVKLHLQSRQEVEAAYLEVEESVRRIAGPGHFEGVTVQPMIKKSGYELILGSSIDPQFGPVLLFGAGGELVEVFQDRALALPPLNTHLARLLMEETKIFKALQGVRGKPGVDLERLAELLVQFSRLVAENPRIKECDINPLLASSERLIALDARIILHPRSVSDADLPRSAIRPYPIHYIGSAVLKGGITVSFRPIAPEHEPLVAHFHRELSEETVRQRYLKALSYEERIAHERLVKICFNDYDREIALIAQVGEEIVGIARLSKGADRREAVFALIVKDKWQNRGIGKELLRRLLAIAQEEKIDTIFAHMLPENGQMRALCEHHHFELHEANGLIVGQWRRPNDRKMYF